MLSSVKLFRLLSDFLFVLLGLLLIWLGLTGRYFFPRRSPAWIGLAAFLVLWGARTWARAGQDAGRGANRVRGGSLLLVGAVMLGIAFLPFVWVGPLLSAAGVILILRGIASLAMVAGSQ